MNKNFAPQNDKSQNVARHEWYEGDIPPVGLAFEFTSNGGHNWSARTILYKDDSVILLDGHQLFKLADPDIGFRPIRTPEQIAEEEKEAAIKLLAEEFFGICMEIRLQMTESVAEIIANNLHMNGYRKLQPRQDVTAAAKIRDNQ